MRQILVLGLLAVLGWWVYGAYVADPASAAPGNSAYSATNADGSTPRPIGEVFGAQAPGAAQVQSAAARPRVTEVPLDAEGRQQLTDIMARIRQGEQAAIDHGWTVLTNRALDPRLQQDLAAELSAGAAGDFETKLARLGTHNTFLHSAAGRIQAGQALEAALAMSGGPAVLAGTRLLSLCMRGRLEKAEVEARAFVDRAYAQHKVRADLWLCDPANVASARSYTVASGDSLSGIAGKFRREGIAVEEGTLAVLNRIHNKNAIKIGQKIKVPVDPIRAVLEKRSYLFGVYVGDSLLRLYWVGHGKDDKTPVTVFTVIEKQPRPEWTAPDGNVYGYGRPENILGEYFIKFSHDSYTGFGAHGTPMPDTIGTMSSMGCIRMLSPDIAELFEILPRGAKVEVRASEAAS